MSYGSALTVLEGIVQTYATGAGIPVVFDNLARVPAHDPPFLVCSFLPAQSAHATIGSSGVDRHPGIYQVAVYSHRDKGSGSALAIADALVSAFKRTVTTEDGVAVHTFRAWPSGGYSKDDFFVVPVSVTWEFHA